jgi:hypothetical protein
MRRFRNSQLALGRECPFAYKVAYVDCEEGVPTTPLRRGSNAHDAVAEVIRSIVRNGIADVHRIVYSTVRGGSGEYADALGIVTTVMEQLGTEWDIDPAAVLFVEERLEMPVELTSGETVTYFGTPDLAERESRHVVKITDHKTNWSPESEAEFRAGPQLRRYALLLHHRFPGIREFRLVKRFVRYHHRAFEEVISADSLELVRQQLVSEIEERMALDEAGEFPATPGSWCSLCRAHARCPVILRYREAGLPDDLAIPDDDRARSMAGDAIALHEASAALKGRLKVYLGADHERGNVPVAGGEYGYGPVEKREVKPHDLRRVLTEHGIEPDDSLFRTDLDALDRTLRRLPDDVVRAVEGVTRRWQTSDCRFRRTTTTTSAPTAAAEAESEELFG